MPAATLGSAEIAYFPLGLGLRTELGTIVPPGGRIAAYVRSGSKQTYDPEEIADNLVTTLAAGLARCRADRNDTVVVLEGHSETTDSATFLANLVDGTRVVGLGRGTNQPTIQLTDTAAQLAMDNDDCLFQNLHLKLEGANGITKAIAVTGANVAIVDCRIEVGTDASNHSAITIEVGSGGDNFLLAGCELYGAVAGAVTNGVLVAAAVDGCRIIGNWMDFATTVNTVGCINVTAAATRMVIKDNHVRMSKSGGTAALTLGNVACTGIIDNNRFFAMGGDATPATTIVVLGAANTMRFGENYGCSEDDLSAVLCPAAT